MQDREGDKLQYPDNFAYPQQKADAAEVESQHASIAINADAPTKKRKSLAIGGTQKINCDTIRYNNRPQKGGHGGWMGLKKCT